MLIASMRKITGQSISSLKAAIDTKGVLFCCDASIDGEAVRRLRAIVSLNGTLATLSFTEDGYPIDRETVSNILNSGDQELKRQMDMMFDESSAG